MRELFIQAVKQFVSDIKFYGLHGLGSSGTTAACNFCVPDRLFKRHGRTQINSCSCNNNAISFPMNISFTFLNKHRHMTRKKFNITSS
jgi:hypothetical protein